MTLDERIQRYLDHCEPAVSGSHGHDTTFRVACALIHGFGLDPQTAFQLLKELYNPRCEPPCLTQHKSRITAPRVCLKHSTTPLT
jgi:hypothetical protein